MARARKKPDEQAPETQIEGVGAGADELRSPAGEASLAPTAPPDPAPTAPPEEVEPAPEEATEAEPATVEAPAEEPEPPAKPARRRRAPAAEAETASARKPRAAKAAKPKAAARKPRAAGKPTGERKPIVRLSRAERPRGKLRERRGIVVSDAMEKSIVVRVDTVRPDRSYRKIVRRSRKLHAHDERNEAKVGDLVRIVETRPISKTKSWRLAEVIEAAK